jgi:glycerophosphoryl diester phosphodiesterase
MLEVIRDAGMTRRVMVQSFDWRTLEMLHQLEPSIRTMYLTADWPDYSTVKDSAWTAGLRLDAFDGSVAHMVRASAGKASGIIWAPNFGSLTAQLVRVGQSLGMQVIPWTVNEEVQMEKLIDWGVDGIISDYPDRLRKVMAQKDITLPKPPR